MRFEVRAAGVFAILLGIGALSGVVFMFGLLSGYDVGRQSQISAAQVATQYVIAPPSATPAPAIANLPANSSTAAAAASTPAGVVPVSAVAPKPPAVTRPRETPHVASAGPPTGNDLDEATAGADDEGESRPSAAAPTPAPPRTAALTPSPRRSYNIHINAAMDLNGANQMMVRLQSLGYQPHLNETQIDGRTWYKVEVGPYASAEEAAAAQTELRQKYNSAFGNVAPVPTTATPPTNSATGADDNEE